MGKLLIFLSLVILLAMSIGANVAPQNPVFWLASVATAYQHVREVLIAILLTQLVTRPPRHVWFRLLSGGTAIIAIAWAIQQNYTYSMLPLDTLSIIGASVAILITALERKSVNLHLQSVYKKHSVKIAAML